MQRFTQLYIELERTTRTSEKVAALRDYFAAAPARDAAWAVYLLSGRKIGRAVSFRALRDWAASESGFPEWMVNECYDLVGDLSETLSLILPNSSDVDPPSLHNVIEQRIKPLAKLSAEQQRELIVQTWSKLGQEQRLVFHKLISVNFRVGVSRLLLIRALAETAGVEPPVIAHRLAGSWTPDEQTMQRLLGASNDDAANSAVPYPFMLAHPLHDSPDSLGTISDWLLEWKWDGIRAQILIRSDGVSIWSRGDELISSAFPEITQAVHALPAGTVLDGEIVAWNELQNRPMTFAKLQRRLNRKHVELSFWPDVPVSFIAFDMLEFDGADLRSQPLGARREVLKTRVASDSVLQVSQPVDCASWDDALKLMQESRERGVEGLMLKRLDSAYQAGRPTGAWWKLKVAPYTVDAVLIMAQSGQGKRAGLLTDYTFGVWEGDELVPVAKAYSGLTDDEITDVDRFCRNHTTGTFGPVRRIEPKMVFELGFEAIQKSTRHKSGVALRFPRMLRMRSDKKPADADSLESLQKLLAESEAR